MEGAMAENRNKHGMSLCLLCASVKDLYVLRRGTTRL